MGYVTIIKKLYKICQQLVWLVSDLLWLLEYEARTSDNQESGQVVLPVYWVLKPEQLIEVATICIADSEMLLDMAVHHSDADWLALVIMVRRT